MLLGSLLMGLLLLSGNLLLGSLRLGLSAHLLLESRVLLLVMQHPKKLLLSLLGGRCALQIKI
jgi:hypothetical protein